MMDGKVAKAQKLLKAFCSVKRESDGGFAEVGNEDVNDLYDLIHTILEAKFEADPDGDLPINFKIIDRTKFEPLFYYPVPYRHKIKDSDKEAQEELLKTLLGNLSMATKAVETHLQITQYSRRESERKAKDDSTKK